MAINIQADSTLPQGYLRIDGTTAATFSATSLTVPGSVSAPNTFGFKNRIINGDMRIDQRNNGAAQTITANTGNIYTIDRWIAICNGANMTSQRVGSVGAYSLQLTGATSVLNPSYTYKIEANNIADLAGQSVTLSFTVSSSTMTSLGVTYYTPTTSDGFGTLNAGVGVQNFTISATPTRYSCTFTLPASAANGLQLLLQTSGAFSSGTLTLSNVQLEKGSIATPFDVRPYGTELQLCQRYFYANTNNVQYTPFAVGGYGIASGNYNSYMPLPVTMRSAPSISNVGTFIVDVGSPDSVTITGYRPSQQVVQIFGTGAARTSTSGQLSNNQNALSGFYCSAEL